MTAPAVHEPIVARDVLDEALDEFEALMDEYISRLQGQRV